MDTGPRPAPIDPDKWRLLMPAYLMGVIVLSLGAFEVLLCRIGLDHNYWTAVMVGAALLFAVYSFGQIVVRWSRRPVGDQALQQAADTLAEFHSSSPIVCRERPAPAPERMTILIAAFLLLAVMAVPIASSSWTLAAVLLAAALLILGIIGYARAARKSPRSPRVLKLDLGRRVAEFEHFTFQTSFWPAQPTPREEIPFAQLLAARFTPGQDGGPGTLRLQTTKGPTSIPETLENFSSARAVLESAATLTYADPLGREANLRAVPRVRVPWAGWLIIVALAGALGAGIWFLLRLR